MTDMTQETPQEECLLIPPDRLGKDTLDALIEEFVLREGTDYGHSEYTLIEKKAMVMSQLKNTNRLQYAYGKYDSSGEAVIRQLSWGLSWGRRSTFLTIDIHYHSEKAYIFNDL